MRKILLLLLSTSFVIGSIGFAAAHGNGCPHRHHGPQYYQEYPPYRYGPPPGYYDQYYDPPPYYYDDRPNVCIGGGSSRFCFRVR